jgi:MFS family permease
MILVSGGALIGLLTFVGNIWVREPEVGRGMAFGMLWSVALFAAALAAGLVSAFLGYQSSLRFARGLGPPKRVNDLRQAERVRDWAIYCGGASIVLIIAGAAMAIFALARVQTHKVHQTMAATRQTAARKFLANRS